MRRIIVIAVSGVALCLADTSCFAYSAKQTEYIRTSYQQCVSQDAKTNIEWLSMFGLKKSTLKSFCKCQSEYVARYVDTDEFFTALTVSQMKCVKKIGGKVP